MLNDAVTNFLSYRSIIIAKVDERIGSNFVGMYICCTKVYLSILIVMYDLQKKTES